MANSRQIISSLKSKIEDLEEGLIRDVAKSVERSTRTNFNRAIPEVPADNPLVSVSSFSWGKKCAIQCRGEQVLFIEFGAGTKHANQTSFMGTTEDNKQIETAPRPWGIVDLGMYHYTLNLGYGRYYMSVFNGKTYHGSRGKDDQWVYLSTSGRLSRYSERWGMNSRGEFKIKTEGIRPVRALYRGVRNGVRKEIARRIAK